MLCLLEKYLGCKYGFYPSKYFPKVLKLIFVMSDKIVIRGAREHNLKNISLEVPRNKLVVFSGISGSGKSSLAFDTIYAEGQRRYVESLSAYARQFLGLMEKPNVDQIEGLSPAISIDQKSASRNPRSTVGTITEIYDYLRLLFARVGHLHCPKCGREVSSQTVQQIVDQINQLNEGSKILILAPIVRGRKGTYEELFADLKKKGYLRVRVDGKVYELEEKFKISRYQNHHIEAVVDRLILPVDRLRLTDSVETAIKLGEGTVIVALQKSNGKVGAYCDTPLQTNELVDLVFSEKFACPHCQVSLPEIEPRTFSFNSPYGACSHCGGLGATLEIDQELVINPSLSVMEGGVMPWSRLMASDSWHKGLVKALAENKGFSLQEPIKNLSPEALRALLYGDDSLLKVTFRNRFNRTRTYTTTFEGIIPNLSRRFKETDSDYVKNEIQKYMRQEKCPLCQGSRLKPEAMSVTVANKSITDVSRLPIKEAKDWVDSLNERTLSEKEISIAHQILKEIRTRLKFLIDVGLDYLSLERSASSLAGGEAQRIRLASQIGSGLTGVLYVLDEPSIGLHQRDNQKLIETLKGLRDLGNSVIVVEHDEETILNSDWVVDIGPGAGKHGGRIVAQGTPQEIIANPESVTGPYLSGQKVVGLPNKTKDNLSPSGKPLTLTILGAEEHNLKKINVSIPLGKFVCVTGVSGSGKSTLINDILYKALAANFYKAKEKPGKHLEIKGTEHLNKVINIDQSPIGRTPRSNPATYTGAFNFIREIFAKTPEAKSRGYGAGRFSFNVKGGRCETCQGDGIIKIEMQFLPDVYVPCEACQAKRYNQEALEIEYKGKNISQVLDMTVEEALNFFHNLPPIKSRLQTLYDVGLNYLHLGQSAPTLSGGEAQRIKLAAELSRRATGKTLYILDEPTTGLHFADVDNLLKVLFRLVEGGNSVLVIEHNLDVVKNADWIIDLGPEGGDGGGEVVVAGTPEEVAKNSTSHTGQYLQKVLSPF
jgi:excinuclease ABC subunit A